MADTRSADDLWMDAAARLGERGKPLARPNPSVGCIISREGRVLARGWTQEGGRPHAEAHALDALAKRGETAKNADIFVSLEPCAHQSKRGPSCAAILAATGPKRVIIGQLDPDPRTAGQGIAQFKAAGIEVSLLDNLAARAALAGYFTRAEKTRPFITLKLAMSQDGFIARKPGEEQWITGPEARRHVHARRAKQDAILVGGATWRVDKPQLNVRLEGLEARSPQRVVLSSRFMQDMAKALENVADVERLEGVQSLYVEGGAKVAQSFMEADLVDRIELYIAPITIESGTAAPPSTLPQALDGWVVTETCQLGSDRYTAYQRNKA